MKAGIKEDSWLFEEYILLLYNTDTQNFKFFMHVPQPFGGHRLICVSWKGIKFYVKNMLINFKDHFKNKGLDAGSIKGIKFQQKDMDWSIKIKHGEKSVLVIEL